MAVTLTTSYQKIATISLTYGEVRTYAKYSSQSSSTNKTTYQLKSTYYTYQAGGVSFSSATGTLDGTTKSYDSTTMPYGETTISEVSRTLTHNSDGSSPSKTVNTSWTASFGGGGSSSNTIKAPKINRYPVLNSGSNFTDRTNPVFNITAYGTFPIRVRLEAGGSHIGTRDLTSKNSQIYTLELTNEERKQLRSKSSDGKTLAVREVVAALSNGSEVAWSFKDYTMTIVKKPVKVMNNGSWVNTFPYIRVNGEWKEAKTYIRVDGSWKEEK